MNTRSGSYSFTHMNRVYFIGHRLVAQEGKMPFFSESFAEAFLAIIKNALQAEKGIMSICNSARKGW
jgi:hypothetical protein